MLSHRHCFTATPRDKSETLYVLVSRTSQDKVTPFPKSDASSTTETRSSKRHFVELTSTCRHKHTRRVTQCVEKENAKNAWTLARSQVNPSRRPTLANKSFQTLTPSDDVADEEQLLALHEGDDDDGVEVEALAEHPEEVARHEVLRHHVQSLAPWLRENNKYVSGSDFTTDASSCGSLCLLTESYSASRKTRVYTIVHVRARVNDGKVRCHALCCSMLFEMSPPPFPSRNTIDRPRPDLLSAGEVDELQVLDGVWLVFAPTTSVGSTQKDLASRVALNPCAFPHPWFTSPPEVSAFTASRTAQNLYRKLRTRFRGQREPGHNRTKSHGTQQQQQTRRSTAGTHRIHHKYVTVERSQRVVEDPHGPVEYVRYEQVFVQRHTITL